MTRDAADVFVEVYGRRPDTFSAEFRTFCLALYIASKERNKNASDEHKEKLKKKYPRVVPVIDQLRAHAAVTATQGNRYANTTQPAKKQPTRTTAGRYR